MDARLHRYNTKTVTPVGSAVALRATRAVVWTLLLLCIVLLLQSALWTPRIPLVLRGAVWLELLVSAVAPALGLLCVALIAPLGHVLVTRVFSVYPFELAEALMLAFFAGYLWARRRSWLGGVMSTDGLTLPTAAFALVVAAACMEHFRVLQLWRDYPVNYVLNTVESLRTSYLVDYPDPRPWIDGRGFLHVPALLLGGIVLMRCTRALCAERPALMRQLAGALVASATVVAALSLVQPLKFARDVDVNVWTAFTSGRWSSPALPSVNGGGAYFLLAAFIAAAAAAGAQRWRLVPLLAAVAAAVAMWLTQTRSAIVAALAVIASVAVWKVGRRVTGLSTGRLMGVAALAAVAFGVFVVQVNPFNVLAAGSARSMLFRVRFAETGLRIFASAPWTGVGPGQYHQLYQFFATPETLALAARNNNAHNYLLWIAAELGVVGLATFVWLLATALFEAVRHLHSSPERFRQVLLAGLAAFIITWSIGQPLELPTVALPFWIALGIAASPGFETRQTARVAWLSPRSTGLVLAGLAIVLAATLPIRVARASVDVDFARVRYGFHNEGDAGRPFRWAGPRVRFYERSTVPAIEVGVAALHPSTPNGARLRVRVDGRAQEPIALPPGEWKDIRLRPSPDSWRGSRYWRIDFDIEPIGAAGPVPESDRRIAISGITPVPAWDAGH